MTNTKSEYALGKLLAVGGQWGEDGNAVLYVTTEQRYIGTEQLNALQVILDDGVKAAQPAKPEWLPIESAPKDGSIYLIANVYGECFCGYYAQEDDCWKVNAYEAVNEPTHWQPLPPAPANQGKA